jgi:hypothetical protein
VTRRELLLGSPFLLAAASPVTDQPKLPFRLVDVTAKAGIEFQHNSGAFGGKYLPETLGSGCAFWIMTTMDGRTSS